jgi:hypothetical protein
MAITGAIPLTEMDGRNLYYTFIAGARKIIEHQIELNKINVFPVRDGDTGTNLASTIRSVVGMIRPHRSYKITADRIAESILINARGNSGIIFAQFFYGLSAETGEYKSVTIRQFADSIQRSVKYVYEAVANPVEGTMLTVISEWADYIHGNWPRFYDFNNLLVSSFDILKRSLAETKAKLEVLAKNNVVDAGAKGFVLFIEGIIEFIHSRNIKALIHSKSEAASFSNIEEVIPERPLFRYCTEALIKNNTADNRSLIRTLENYGDSVVVAGADKIRRIHLHTNTPALLFDNLRKTGTITFQKADDMVRQSEAVYNRKWNIALVTDSTCDLSDELIDQYQINMVPINIHFGENHYLDKITIKPDRFYQLLRESPDYPKSSQINEKTFFNLFSHLASHYDSIISVHLSDKLSGTFNSSLKAAKAVSREFGKTVTVLNSKNISGALGLTVLRVAQAIEKGFLHDQITEMAAKWINDTRVYVSVRTLKYLIRGGRLSAFRGLIARMLNINPIVSVDETGKAVVFDKALNQKAIMEKVIRHVKSVTGGRKIWNYIVLHASNPEAAEWYIEKMMAITGIKPASVVDISPIIGANTGIGAAAVSFQFE